jgi:hypothetical protein
MATRFKEHHLKTKVDGRTDEYDSPVGQHARVTKHHFRPEDVTYLDRESDKRARGIKEAVYARALKPDLNKEGGLRYVLPTTYDTLLKNSIRPPKPPPPSAPGSPPPTYDINVDLPKGRQPGAKNIPQCLPLVLAAIARAAHPPPPPPPPPPPQLPPASPRPARGPGRPRKKTTPTNNDQTPPTPNRTTPATVAHQMRTRAQTRRDGESGATQSPAGTGPSLVQKK